SALGRGRTSRPGLASSSSLSSGSPRRGTSRARARRERESPPMTNRTSTAKKGRTLTPEKIFDLLVSARAADRVSLYFRDGRIASGAVIFNESKGTGRVIDVDEEISADFRVEDLRDVRF